MSTGCSYAEAVMASACCLAGARPGTTPYIEPASLPSSTSCSIWYSGSAALHAPNATKSEQLQPQTLVSNPAHIPQFVAAGQEMRGQVTPGTGSVRVLWAGGGAHQQSPFSSQKELTPRCRRKKPSSPQKLPQELRISQKGVPSSSPQPTT